MDFFYFTFNFKTVIHTPYSTYVWPFGFQLLKIVYECLTYVKVLFKTVGTQACSEFMDV